MTRRMWEPKITNDGDFIELSHSAQVLYWRIMENADDDGIIGSLKPLLRLYNISPDALQELLDHGYIIRVNRDFVVRHWFVHNRFRKETYTPSIHTETKKYLDFPDNSKQRIGWVYTIQEKQLQELLPLQNVDDYYPKHNNGVNMMQTCTNNDADMLQECATVSKVSTVSTDKLSKGKLSKGSKQSELSQHRQIETTTSSSLGAGGAAAPIEKDTSTNKDNDQTRDEKAADKEKIKPTSNHESVDVSNTTEINYIEAEQLTEDFLQRPLQSEEKAIVLELIAKHGNYFFKALKATLSYMRENPDKNFSHTLDSLRHLFDRRPKKVEMPDDALDPKP